MSGYPHVPGPDPQQDATLAALLDALYARHNDAVVATLVYGSCLRSGDIYDGLLDLYLVCDSYRAAYGPGALAAGNWLLPPNVFYAEQTGADKTLRAKVTVISLRDFERGCSRAWFESYIWGRFAQPTCIIRARDAQCRARVEGALLNAAGTLLQRALPALPAHGTVTSLWQQALDLSYATELRTERPGRAAELAQSSREFYASVTRHHAGTLAHGFVLEEATGELRYRSRATAGNRAAARLAWGVRRVLGKVFSVLRLLKGLLTFEGGLDYIAWKLERHSGQEVVIPEKVRRAPLIHLWGFFWGLYRRGIFR
ncbi:MAG: hypothetical protein R3228_06520 [Halioglobus sp.]|nr:hypothetical protein [Halioglobus sp.]